MVFVQDDGSIKSSNGEFTYFSLAYFRDNICRKGHCFVCGANRGKHSNGEHVFPTWILNACGISNKTLALPNDKTATYSTYTVSCCVACNARLSEVYENQISSVFKEGFESLVSFIKEGPGIHLIRAWLSLIFLKVHLRDFRNRVNLDRRAPSEKIGEQYDLHELHHLHALARAPAVGIAIDSQVFGSLTVMKVSLLDTRDQFDYADTLIGRTLLLRIKDIALVYVLDDCGYTTHILKKQLETLPVRLSYVQVREVFARFAAANMHITTRPEFMTKHIGPTCEPVISMSKFNPEISEYKPGIFGEMLASALQGARDNLLINDEEQEDVLERVKTGEISFLFDKNNNPIEN